MTEKCPYLLDESLYMKMGQFEAGGLPVILLCSKSNPAHYCVQYAGNGKYFDTMREAMLYMHKRWGRDIIGKPRTAWEPGPARPIGEN